MHNEYVKSLILPKEKRLKILKYDDVDITEVSPVLGPITLNLMEHCYDHTLAFHEYNKKNNKRYPKIQRRVSEQLKDLLFIKKEFIENFLNLDNKTRGDLFTYLYAFQMSEQFYDQYIFRVLVESLKDEFSKEFWKKHELDKYVAGIFPIDNYRILSDTKDEINTGKVGFNFKEPLEIIDKIINNSDNEKRIMLKLDIIKAMGNVIDNYPCQEFLMVHMPYKDSINELVDNIKVSLDYEKPKQLIRRNGNTRRNF